MKRCHPWLLRAGRSDVKGALWSSTLNESQCGGCRPTMRDHGEHCKKGSGCGTRFYPSVQGV